MSTTLWDQQGIAIHRREFNCMPLAIGGRITPKIHCHIRLFVDRSDPTYNIYDGRMDCFRLARRVELGAQGLERRVVGRRLRRLPKNREIGAEGVPKPVERRIGVGDAHAKLLNSAEDHAVHTRQYTRSTGTRHRKTGMSATH